jgi:hypothetical protein
VRGRSNSGAASHPKYFITQFSPLTIRPIFSAPSVKANRREKMELMMELVKLLGNAEIHDNKQAGAAGAVC